MAMIDDYKQKFIELFRQMEKECGDCESVEITTAGTIRGCDGVIVSKRIVCEIKF